MATLVLVADETFDSQPARRLKAGVAVMLERTSDEIKAIQQLWPRFENLVGLRGRRMYAMVDTAAASYAACTPIRADDDPAGFGLDTGVLPGGWYLSARIIGEPPELYDRIGPAMRALAALATVDPDRPLVEYYRRHDQIELWVPVPELPDLPGQPFRAGSRLRHGDGVELVPQVLMGDDGRETGPADGRRQRLDDGVVVRFVEEDQREQVLVGGILVRGQHTVPG